MSRTGSYLGGSTIIHGGSGWFSHGKAKNKKRPAVSPENELQAERRLLAQYISSETNLTPIKKPPSNTPRALVKRIEAKGGIQKWATSHSFYAKALAEQARRKKKREKRILKKKQKLSSTAVNGTHKKSAIKPSEFVIKESKEFVRLPKAEKSPEEVQSLQADLKTKVNQAEVLLNQIGALIKVLNADNDIKNRNQRLMNTAANLERRYQNIRNQISQFNPIENNQKTLRLKKTEENGHEQK